MNVLVTGGTGFIGQYVVRILKEYNISTIITCRTNHTKPIFPTLYLDLSDPSSFANILKYSFDAVIHLAWEGLPHYLSPHHILEELPNQIRFLESVFMVQSAFWRPRKRFSLYR